MTKTTATLTLEALLLATEIYDIEGIRAILQFAILRDDEPDLTTRILQGIDELTEIDV